MLLLSNLPESQLSSAVEAYRQPFIRDVGCPVVAGALYWPGPEGVVGPLLDVVVGATPPRFSVVRWSNDVDKAAPEKEERTWDHWKAVGVLHCRSREG